MAGLLADGSGGEISGDYSIEFVLFSVCAVVGWLLFVFFTILVRRAISSRRWLRVPARIIRRECREDWSIEGGGEKFDAQIEYEYQVGDRRFRGDRLRWVNVSGSRRSVLKTLRGLGQAAEGFGVFCNPRKPEQSVVLTGLHPRLLFGWCFSLVFPAAFTALLLLILARRGFFHGFW